MAKITGPLCSQTASGNFAKGAIQFRTGLGGSHAYKPVDPAKQNQALATAAQQAQRIKFKAVRDLWRSLSDDQRNQYKLEAKKTDSMNGWNLFLAENLQTIVVPLETLLTANGLPLLDENDRILLFD